MADLSVLTGLAKPLNFLAPTLQVMQRQQAFAANAALRKQQRDYEEKKTSQKFLLDFQQKGLESIHGKRNEVAQAELQRLYQVFQNTLEKGNAIGYNAVANSFFPTGENTKEIAKEAYKAYSDVLQFLGAEQATKKEIEEGFKGYDPTKHEVNEEVLDKIMRTPGGKALNIQGAWYSGKLDNEALAKMQKAVRENHPIATLNSALGQITTATDIEKALPDYRAQIAAFGASDKNLREKGAIVLESNRNQLKSLMQAARSPLTIPSNLSGKEKIEAENKAFEEFLTEYNSQIALLNNAITNVKEVFERNPANENIKARIDANDGDKNKAIIQAAFEEQKGLTFGDALLLNPAKDIKLIPGSNLPYNPLDREHLIDAAALETFSLSNTPYKIQQVTNAAQIEANLLNTEMGIQLKSAQIAEKQRKAAGETGVANSPFTVTENVVKLTEYRDKDDKPQTKAEMTQGAKKLQIIEYPISKPRTANTQGNHSEAIVKYQYKDKNGETIDGFKSIRPSSMKASFMGTAYIDNKKYNMYSANTNAEKEFQRDILSPLRKSFFAEQKGGVVTEDLVFERELGRISNLTLYVPVSEAEATEAGTGAKNEETQKTGTSNFSKPKRGL